MKSIHIGLSHVHPIPSMQYRTEIDISNMGVLALNFHAGLRKDDRSRKWQLIDKEIVIVKKRKVLKIALGF